MQVQNDQYSPERADRRVFAGSGKSAFCGRALTVLQWVHVESPSCRFIL